MFDDLSLQYILEVPSRTPDTQEMPMVVMIHGRGADAHDLRDLAPLLDPREGCRFVFPNAAKPFEPYPGMALGWTWFDGWPPLKESVASSSETLLRFLDEVVARYPTPEGRLILSGFSQGALMALEAGLKTRQRVAGIVAMSGGLFEETLPELATRKGQRVLIAHGTEDDVVPVTYARRARHVLEAAGLEVEYHEYPMSHQVDSEEIEAVRNFIARCLAG